jgi:hypothetical protein
MTDISDMPFLSAFMAKVLPLAPTKVQLVTSKMGSGSDGCDWAATFLKGGRGTTPHAGAGVGSLEAPVSPVLLRTLHVDWVSSADRQSTLRRASLDWPVSMEDRRKIVNALVNVGPEDGGIEDTEERGRVATETAALQGLLLEMVVKDPLEEEVKDPLWEEVAARAHKERELLAHLGIAAPPKGVRSCVSLVWG